MKPIIGILTCGFQEKKQFVTNTYIKAVRLSGGSPILIPALPPESEVEAYLTVCDGFLLPGGGDFTPFLFNEEPHTKIGETNLGLDVFQIHFTEEILKTKKPVLGICRGMQVMNAACGGTIYQDLSLQPGEVFLHMQTSQNRSDVSHQVSIKKGCLLYSIIGSSIFTNSFHHQSVHLLGNQVCSCGHTSDGTIEAIEIENHPFAVGVQWHPEAMFFTSAHMRKLFSVYINAATRNMP